MEPGTNQKGFTLVEMAMVLIIFGMIMIAVMAGVSLYNEQRVTAKTNKSIENSNSVLLEYVQAFGVYPCPADASLGPGNPLYGVEQRGPITDFNDPGYDFQNCLTPANRTEPGRDTIDNSATPDTILVGAIPFTTITQRLSNLGEIWAEFSDYETIDGWGNKLTYAVTTKLTNQDTFDSKYGTIDVVEENGVSLLDETEDPGDDVNNNGVRDFGRYAHFVLVSHGQNGRGAFSRAGSQNPCVLGVVLPPTLPPGVTSVNETENCDYLNTDDGVFFSGLANDREDSFNDDKLKFTLFEDSDLWRYVGNTSITNTNAGNVGMGIDTPEQQLHVRDNITAVSVEASRFTDRTGENAIRAATLAGDPSLPAADVDPASAAMYCGDAEVVQSISRDPDTGLPRVICAKPWNSTIPTGDVLCGKDTDAAKTQMVMYGLKPKANGGIDLMCCNPKGGSKPCP